MTTITRHGALVQVSDEIKKELTVRPLSHDIPAPSFKVYRQYTLHKSLLIPRYYAYEKFGPPAKELRDNPTICRGITFTGNLRTSTRQPEAFAAGIKAFEEVGGGVLSLPCGFGKTTVALALSAHLKVRTIIVVHKEFLANQWTEKIKEFCPGATIGRIQGSIFDIEKDFVIALIQTMSMREFDRRAFDSIGLLIVDEAHHIGAPAFSQFMFKICPKYTLGLTATPERKDGLTRLLYWFLGPEFFRVERTAEKSTRVTTVHYKSETFKEAPPVTRFGKINMAAMVSSVSELQDRNALIVKIIHECLCKNRRILVLSDRREHCFELQRTLGSIAGLYIGGLKEAELEETARKSVVVATFQLAHEGLDIPVLDTVILATPKSDIKQSIGRIMRETPGKLNSPLIFDIVDHWSVFFSMYNKRRSVYRQSGFVMEESPPEAEVFGKGKCMFT